MAVRAFYIIPPCTIVGPVTPRATCASRGLGLASSCAMAVLLALTTFKILKIAWLYTVVASFIVSYFYGRDGGIKRKFYGACGFPVHIHTFDMRNSIFVSIESVFNFFINLPKIEFIAIIYIYNLGVKTILYLYLIIFTVLLECKTEKRNSQCEQGQPIE